MLLADSGRFAYAGTSFSHSLRPYAHLTHAHNTLRIDLKQQQTKPPLATAAVSNHSWNFQPSFYIVQGNQGLWDGLEGTACHSRSVYYQRGEWLVVVDAIDSDRGKRTVQATWHGHPNVSLSNFSTSGGDVAFILGGVDGHTGSPTEAQVAIIPAGGDAAMQWNAGVSVIEGVPPNSSDETQGWYSASYSDAQASPVLVYNAQLASDQKQATFAWLLVTSATSDIATPTKAEIVVTAVNNTAVDLSVTVGGAAPKAITVPVQRCA